MVARRAHNPEVRGSSPLSATRSEHRMHAARFIRAVSFFLLPAPFTLPSIPHSPFPIPHSSFLIPRLSHLSSLSSFSSSSSCLLDSPSFTGLFDSPSSSSSILLDRLPSSCGFLKKVALYLFLVDIAYRHVPRNSSNSIHLPGGTTDGKSHPNMAANRPPLCNIL